MLVRGYRGKHPMIGERVFIAETAAVIGDVEIGDDCSIWYGTVIRADVNQVRIGARTNIQDNCTLHVTRDTWPVILEDEVTLGHGVIAHGCTVRRGSLLGIGSLVLDGAVIGEECIVAAGTLVPEGTIVPPRSLVMGVPGRVRRSLGDDDLRFLARFHRNYLEYKEIYLEESPGEFR
ncbi:MAG TPA: gamma carbonic anhydrase family protein [Thermoanaerobaculia bacterium]|nr:gamma carbonic anhydrase family protein [Thermoanaerobaculia bacterium]